MYQNDIIRKDYYLYALKRNYSFLQLICSYLFWPLVFLMGVESRDCCVVARMVGIKTFINEFLAYEDLGKVRKNNDVFDSYTGQWTMTASCDVFLVDRNETLKGGVLTVSISHAVSFCLFLLFGLYVGFVIWFVCCFVVILLFVLFIVLSWFGFCFVLDLVFLVCMFCIGFVV